MARVFIPAQWRDLTEGASEVRLEGSTLGQVIGALERRFPGISGRVCDEGAIAGGLAVSIDGAMTARGLLAPVAADSEIHFLPAIGGG
jgi:molybdopterin synthase sulfur carrier subunit